MAATTFIWDGENYLAEADDTDAVSLIYTCEPLALGSMISQRRSGSSAYLHFDGINSTRQLTSNTSSVTDTWIYDSWGGTIARTGLTLTCLTWLGELGYYFDSEASRFYVRERQYVASIGRWDAMDPLLFVDGANWYIYGLNSPVLFVDPSGAKAACCKVHPLFTYNIDDAFDCKAEFQKNSKKPPDSHFEELFLFGFQFYVNADFIQGGAGNPLCKCCEYRQYVTATVRKRWRTRQNNGKLVLPTPASREWKYVQREGELQEDCKDGLCFGYRKRGKNERNDQYTKERLTGCSYNNEDRPGVRPSFDDETEMLNDATNVLEIDLTFTFLLNIVDVCPDVEGGTPNDVVVKSMRFSKSCCGMIEFVRGKPTFVSDPARADPSCGK